MKKIFRNIAIASLVAIMFFFASCERLTFDYSGPALVSFTDGTASTFYVQDIANPVDTIVVGVTSISGSDRTVNFVIDDNSSAVAGTHYNISGTSVTIPANSSEGYIVVEGIYDGFAGETRSLMLKVTGGDIDTAQFDNEYLLLMQQYCPFDINTFAGTWDVDEVSVYNGPYPTYQITATVGEGDTLIIDGLWGGLEEPTKFVFNDADPANFTVGIPPQFAFNHPTYGVATVEQLAIGSFSSCDMTISVSYKIFVEAGFFDQVTECNMTFVSGPPVKEQTKSTIQRELELK